MLNAIVIYDNSNQANKTHPKKLKHACKKSRGLFGAEDFAVLDKAAQSIMIEGMPNNQIYQFKVENEHQYFKQSDNILIAIVSQKPLDNSELCYLFKNILHVHSRSETVKTTLDDIVVNPLRYIAKDLLTEKIQEAIDDTKVKIMEVVEKVQGRGVQLKALAEETTQLDKLAIEFVNRTKKPNSCCGV